MPSPREHITKAADTAREPIAQPDQVTCDLCGWPMAVPEHCIEQREILGLLVCTACIEDHLEAQFRDGNLV